MLTVDARGLSCPQPVIETKKAIKSNPKELTVLVDNVAAFENVTRFGKANGYEVEGKEEGGVYALSLAK